MFDAFVQLMQRGSWAMWPLLVLSVIGVALIFERAWFWLRTNPAGRLERIAKIASLLRHARIDAVRPLVANDGSVYGRLAQVLIDEGADESVVTEAIETQRPRVERFMSTLSTIITAAPMIGILGTVTGLIGAFRVLATTQGTIELSDISGPIAEALLTTAAGLVVAVVVLFPYNAFRAQIDRTLGRMETIYAAASSGRQVHARQGGAEPRDAGKP